MTEDFLHFLWKHKRIDMNDLQTTSGERLEVLEFGVHNTDSGPDFSLARIEINGRTWVGNIEIHVRSSDWDRHRHHKDPSYGSVILHVVYIEDRILHFTDGERIPTLVLKGRFDEYLYWRYEQILGSKGFIPCEGHWRSVPSISKEFWLERMSVERLELMSLRFASFFNPLESPESWTYQWVGRALGLTKNASPMLALTRRVPLGVLKRHKEDPDQLMALLYGAAGWLEDEPLDDFHEKLIREYNYLKHKYSLIPMERIEWMSFRLYPGSLPFFRIAQLAILVRNIPSWSELITTKQNLKDLERSFILNLPEYFSNHKDFGALSKKLSGGIGKDMAHRLILNGIIPVKFHEFTRAGSDELRDHSLELLKELKGEHNSVTRGFVKMGITVDNAFRSQALIHLKRKYCDARKCVFCGIGTQILKN